MIINIDARDMQLKIIELCFNNWDVFFRKLFDYLINPCYGTEAAFLYQLTHGLSMKSMTSLYMFDSKDEKEAIKKLSYCNSPNLGFSNMLVLRIKTEYSIYFTKFWEDDKIKTTNLFKKYIKGYEIGTIDDYIGEFEKIK